MYKSTIFDTVTNQLEEDKKASFLELTNHAVLWFINFWMVLIIFGIAKIVVGVMGIAFFKVDFKLGAVLIVSEVKT